MTVTDGVGDPQGTARVCTDTIRSGAREGRMSDLRRRSPGAVALAWVAGPKVGRAPTRRLWSRMPGPTHASFAEEMLQRPSGERSIVPHQHGEWRRGHRDLGDIQTRASVFPSSNVFIPTEGVGRSSSGRSPFSLGDGYGGCGLRGRDRQGRRGPRGRRGPLPSYCERREAVRHRAVALVRRSVRDGMT